MSDGFNNIIINQVISTLWASSNSETLDTQYQAVLPAMMGIEPRDEIEGMLAAQMAATHNAAMECYRRSMLDNQTFEGRRESLNQANKLTRSYATLMEALNRHRGKGQQKVTVEHVHVNAGGQAIVGVVNAPAVNSEHPERQADAIREIADVPDPPLRCSRTGSPCRSPPVRKTPL